LSKGCLRCALKHLLKAKGYTEESLSFGMNVPVDLNQMDHIMLDLINYIKEMKK